ncbi:MAG: hypothetical protein JO131_08225, partial [Gammaproteobacteria bacterium]|nr:hypothetical protein [Gammaproteobacteria bacterium]
PNDLIAYCELDIKNSNLFKEKQYQTSHAHLLKLKKEQQLILYQLIDEKNYYEYITRQNENKNYTEKTIEADKEYFATKQRIANLTQQYDLLTQRIEQIKKQYKELAENKRFFALKLADYYETKKCNYSDKRKAIQYLTIATNAAYSQSGFANTATFYKYTGLFTAERLFVLRGNNILKYFNKDFIPTFSKTLCPFALFGFSYGLELLFDIGILVKAFLKGQSVRDTFYKDDRPARMANAFVWLACNMLCFVISGGIINAVANLTAFAFDIGNELYRTRKELKKYETLLHKVTEKIKILEGKINKTSADLSTEKNELEKLRCVQNQLQNKIQSVKQKRYWIVACTAMIFVGMALVLFPPAFIPYAGLIGSVIAFTSGSVFLGLGKRVFEWVRQLKIQQSPVVVKKPMPVPNKLQFLKNIIVKVSAKQYVSLSMQMSVLTKYEIRHLRISLGMHKNDALWQQQLKNWMSNAGLTSTICIDEKKALSTGEPVNQSQKLTTDKPQIAVKPAKNCNTFFYNKSHPTFLQTLQNHLEKEQQQYAHSIHS